MISRPDRGGSGRWGGRQWLGCAAATAVLNRPSRKARLDPATIRCPCRFDGGTLHGGNALSPVLKSAGAPVGTGPLVIRKANAHCPARQGKIDSFQAIRNRIANTGRSSMAVNRIRHQWPEGQRRRRARHAAAVDRARAPQTQRHQIRLRHRPVRRLHRPCGRPRGALLPGHRIAGRGQARHHHRGAFARRPIIRCSAPGSPSRCRNAATASPARSCRRRICWRRNKKPTREQIVEHMDGNLCRCGTYPRIVRAIQRAARESVT